MTCSGSTPARTGRCVQTAFSGGLENVMSELVVVAVSERWFDARSCPRPGDLSSPMGETDEF
jgi:hypothetical protein